jgi:hypothetical protein
MSEVLIMRPRTERKDHVQVKVKLSLCLTNYVMKTYGVVDV